MDRFPNPAEFLWQEFGHFSYQSDGYTDSPRKNLEHAGSGDEKTAFKITGGRFSGNMLLMVDKSIRGFCFNHAAFYSHNIAALLYPGVFPKVIAAGDKTDENPTYFIVETVPINEELSNMLHFQRTRYPHKTDREICRGYTWGVLQELMFDRMNPFMFEMPSGFNEVGIRPQASVHNVSLMEVLEQRYLPIYFEVLTAGDIDIALAAKEVERRGGATDIEKLIALLKEDGERCVIVSDNSHYDIDAYRSSPYQVFYPYQFIGEQHSDCYERFPVIVQGLNHDKSFGSSYRFRCNSPFYISAEIAKTVMGTLRRLEHDQDPFLEASLIREAIKNLETKLTEKDKVLISVG